MDRRRQVAIRDATQSDLAAIIEIARATGQEEDWTTVFPAYVRHLISHGRLLVGVRNAEVIGFGGTRQIGSGPAAISMLTDLFVDPAAHGTGTGRAILDALWAGQPRKMTFSSLHSSALPLYTSFGVDAWWPASQPVAVGTGGGVGAEYGISHLVATGSGEAHAADAVIAALSWLRPADGRAHVCLPAPHPAVRRHLAVGWKVSDLDLYLASEPGLIDPLSSVPSPALA